MDHMLMTCPQSPDCRLNASAISEFMSAISQKTCGVDLNRIIKIPSSMNKLQQSCTPMLDHETVF